MKTINGRDLKFLRYTFQDFVANEKKKIETKNTLNFISLN